MSGSIDTILSNAASGLRASQAGMSVLSDNIANANVAGYTEKTQDVSSFVAGGQSQGVRTGLVSRQVDAALQASVWSAGSRVSALTVRSQVLQAVNATQGTPGAGASLADAVTALQSSFTELDAQPSSQTQQAAVVAAAGTLASSINSAASSINAQRNSVQSQIASSIGTLNAALQTVDSTTQDIIAAKGANQSTATLEDQRDQALQTVSSMMDVSYSEQANGGVTILGTNGFEIPLDSQFSTQNVTLSPASSYTQGGGAVPPIMMQSGAGDPPTDVTTQISGGQLGELIQLRDSTLPSYAAQLDNFSAKLANQFTSQGLQLFTDGSGAATLSASPGLSSVIAVNPAVTANAASVRDGTTGTPFTPNPASGPAGYTDLINRVLNNTFASTGASTSLSADAQSFVSQQSTAAAQAGTDLTNATAYQSTVSSRFSDESGVDVDGELGLMIQLQNSYQANARVVQTVQAMFDALMNSTTAA